MWKFDGFADNIAITTEEGNKITYDELAGKGLRLIEKIGKRCLVFVLCRNEKGALLGYTAFLHSGIVPVMLEANLEKTLLASLMKCYNPDFLWLPVEMSSDFNHCKCVYETWSYALLKTKNEIVYPLYENLALLLTTSGSTGSPKLVRQSYDNVRANTESIADYLSLDANELPITTMPMSYTYGLSIINTHLWVGAPVLLTQKTLMQKDFWRQMRDCGVTSFGGVPYIYEMLDKLRFFQMQLPALHTMTQAGGKLSPELHKKFAEYAIANKKRFIVMYGQTEATARMSWLPHEKSLEKYGSMGIAIPGGEFSLIDVDGNEITKPEVVGELVYKGANVTLGYAECGEDLIKEDERGGVLQTGDMAKRDSDGYYYIAGRKKRFLKIYGSRVNLDETERLLNSEFVEVECACGGVDDKMAVYITNGKAADSVIKYLVEKTRLNHKAFEVIPVGKIPRNDSGKVLYSKLEVERETNN